MNGFFHIVSKPFERSVLYCTVPKQSCISRHGIKVRICRKQIVDVIEIDIFEIRSYNKIEQIDVFFDRGKKIEIPLYAYSLIEGTAEFTEDHVFVEIKYDPFEYVFLRLEILIEGVSRNSGAFANIRDGDFLVFFYIE